MAKNLILAISFGFKLNSNLNQVFTFRGGARNQLVKLYVFGSFIINVHSFNSI